MRFKKINTRIIAAILPVVFLATLSLVLISYVASRDRIDAETEQKLFAILETEAARIQDELSKDAAIAQALVSYVTSAPREVFSNNAYLRFMFSIIPSNKNTVGGGIWFEPYALGPRTKYFGPYVYREGGEYRLTQMYANDEYNYPKTRWYTNGKNSGGPIAWTDVYFDPLSGITMLTGAQPFYDEKRNFLGTCTADMDIVDIRRFVQAITVGKTGRAFLIGSNGGYIVAKDQSKTPDMLMVNDPDPAYAALGRELMSRDRGTSFLEMEGVLHRVHFLTLPEIGWTLGIAMAEHEISAPTRSLTITMLAVAFIALLVIAVSVMMLAGHLHRIINQVNRFSNLAAAGNLQERISLDTHDEFASIAENLNRMMDNMVRLSRARGDFLSRMSHEIRTPMNAIIGMAQIGKNAKEQEKIKDCLLKIEDNSTHLLGIINDILDLSKVEAGKFTLDKGLFSLSENMDFVVSMFASRVSEKQLNLSLHLHDIVHDGIVTDSLRLNQVLINLLSNAVKFTGEGGAIQVDVREEAYEDSFGEYSFSVRDNGIGVSPHEVGKLFNPFEQASPDIGSRFGGTGLGLSISRSIVEMMGGRLSLSSTPGVGSVFSFTIRVEAHAASGGQRGLLAASKADIPDYAGKRILIVDDIEINRDIAMELLQETGIAMECAENGLDALEKFRSSPVGHYDVILMDIQMPVMDGCAATIHIRSTNRADAELVKIVAMTADVMRDDVKRVFDAGMNSHIAKPIVVSDMFKKLNEMLL